MAKLDKLITFGGPNNGIFGIPDCNRFSAAQNNVIINGTCQLFVSFVYDQLLLPTTGPAILDPIAYSLKNISSYADYWNSPADILQKLTWLAMINNQNNTLNKACSGTNITDKYLYKKLKKLVMIIFGNDTTVKPKNSESFGY